MTLSDKVASSNPPDRYPSDGKKMQDIIKSQFRGKTIRAKTSDEEKKS